MKKLKKIQLHSTERPLALANLSRRCLSQLTGGVYYGGGMGSCGCGCLGPSGTFDNAAANSASLLDTPGDWTGSVVGGGPGVCWLMIWDSSKNKYYSADVGSRG